MAKLNLATRHLRSSSFTRRAAARWPWAGLLLAFALSLAGARQIPSAQAAPSGSYSENVLILVTKAGSAGRTICVGDQVDVRVSLLYVVDVVEAQAGGKQFGRLFGVPLAASVTDPGIGAISPAANVTSLDSDPMGVARFTFAAKKAGTTTVKVDAKIINKQLLGVVLSSDTVTGELPLTVEKCEYRIDATEIWYIKGLIKAVAKITDAALAPDADGSGNYHGTADVIWSTTNAVPGRCHVFEHGPAPSQVHLTGKTIPGDVIAVSMIFEQTESMTSTMICPEGSVDMPGSVQLQPETLNLSFRTTGGIVSRQPKLGGVETSSALASINLFPVPGK